MKTNDLGFPVVSDAVHKQLFGGQSRASLTPSAKQRVHDHYKHFGVKLPPDVPPAADYNWQLPRLQGSTQREHFEAIAKELAGRYDELAWQLVEAEQPAMPAAHEVVLAAGWHRYAPGQPPAPVAAPLEPAYIFDCETYVIAGSGPIMATAVSTEAWYVWLHESLVDESVPYTQQLFSIGDGKLCIGHNATYDFQRSIESHWLTVPPGCSRSYFLDTMSMHIVTAGFTGPQRWVTFAKSGQAVPPWADKGCGNSLLSCYNFHVRPEVPLGAQAKELRDIFVTQPLSVIRAKLRELLHYALLDVCYTQRLFAALYPTYRRLRPSYVAFAGALLQSAHNLPVVDNWLSWVAECDAKLDEYELAIDKAGRDIADELLRRYKQLQQQSGCDDKLWWRLHNEALEVLSKAPSKTEFDKRLGDEWYELVADKRLGYKVLNWFVKPRVRSGRGLPEWYRSLGSAGTLGRSSRLLQQLLCIEAEDSVTGEYCAVYWGGKDAKWCYTDSSGAQQSVYKFGTESLSEGLLTKDHKELYESNQLRVTAPGADKVLQLSLAVTYWVSVRSRVKQQSLMRMPYSSKSGSGVCNVIVPDLVPNGTVSGRGVAPLWLTVTDCKPGNNFKLGVELKSRVQAPPGRILVQADFSAQELRLAAVYADSIAARAHADDTVQLGYIGACLMSHGVYAGNKELGTDPHTMLAKAVGVSRANAKTARYAALYGGGRKTVATALMWDLRELPLPKPAIWQQAMNKADQALTYMKGKAARGSNVYVGGTDSAGYTMLSILANRKFPRTPLLRNRMTAPLCPEFCGSDFATARVNWNVQAGARDQADCLMVAFEWLCRKHRVDARSILLYSCH